MKWPFLGGREEVGKELGGGEGGKRGRGVYALSLVWSCDFMQAKLFSILKSCTNGRLILGQIQS
jgi:hypothetical protein